MIQTTTQKSPPTISIIIPCFNEEKYILKTVDKILRWRSQHAYKTQIILVDDGSMDNTPTLIETLSNTPDLLLLKHERNKGKGASIQTALKEISGDIIIIQDADSEYDPSDYEDLLTPILSEEADVVYGSRFLGSKQNRALYPAYALGNKLVTWFCNLVCGLRLTDMETGYKVIKRTFLNQLTLRENRFGIEPEITCKLSRIKDIRMKEVPISYQGRSFGEGKKIRWWDGVYAFICIIRYRLFR